MARTRIRPRPGYRTPAFAPILDDAQIKELHGCGLPSEVLPDLEQLAARAIQYKNLPTAAEVRAALASLRKSIRTTRTALRECDEWTHDLIDLAAANGDGNIVLEASACLRDLEEALKAAEKLPQSSKAAARDRARIRIAHELYYLFRKHGLPFNRNYKSLAPETLTTLLSLVDGKKEQVSVDYLIRKVLADIPGE